MNRSIFHTFTRILLFSLILCGVLLPSGNAWSASPLVVFYPEVREPYLSVFNNIIHGIESRSNNRVVSYALPDDFDPAQVEDWLETRKPAAIVTLGTRGLEMAKQIDQKIPVLVGAVLLSPNGLSGISMAADPLVLFTSLKQMAPQTRRVFVVYAPESSSWLIDKARDACARLGLQLIALPVNDLRQAINTYQDLIEFRLGSTDAVWLTTDDVSANDRVILPLLLEAAWNKNFILFSSKPSHAKQGALFSSYPDHIGMGRSLADMAKRISSDKNSPTLLPTKDLLTAVNLRTAAHLGLTFSSEQLNRFQLKYP